MSFVLIITCILLWLGHTPADAVKCLVGGGFAGDPKVQDCSQWCYKESKNGGAWMYYCDYGNPSSPMGCEGNKGDPLALCKCNTDLCTGGSVGSSAAAQAPTIWQFLVVLAGLWAWTLL